MSNDLPQGITETPLRFSDLPQGATVVSTPKPSALSPQFSDLPQGAMVVSVPQLPPGITESPIPQTPDKLGTAATPKPSFGENVAQGVGTAAAQSLSTLGSLGSHIPGVQYAAGKVGDVLGLPKLAPSVNPYETVSRSTAANAAAANQTTGGKVGTGAESIAEFFLGDEALKGLSVAERLGMGAKVAKLAESNPILAKIITHGLNAVRGGTVVTGQELAHGATPTQAIESGAGAAALGTGVGAAVEGAGVARNAIKAAYKSALDTKSIQPVLQQGIRDTLANVAEDSGVVKSVAPSIRDVAQDTADQIYAKSKAQYQALDEATGGRVQRFKDRLDNIRQSLDSLTGTEEDIQKEASLLKAQKETEDAMQEAFKDAKAKGVDPKLVDEANANFKKSQALYDLDKHLKMSASGMRPNVGGALATKNPEAVDPNKMFPRTNRLYDSGRLQEAVGQQNAENLLDHVNTAYVQQQKILANQALAKTVGKYAAYGAGAGALGAHYIGHLLE